MNGAPAETFDAIVVGGGHNGLVAAAYLARAGRSVLVLERREILGGATVTEAVWPGYAVSTASYVCSLLDPAIVRELDLARFGYEAYRKDPASFTPLPDGRSLLLGADPARNAREIAAFEPDDVRGFAAFDAEATRLGALLASAHRTADAREVRFEDADWQILTGSAAALVERYVATPVLQATLATDGLIGTDAGPRDRGTAYVLAHHHAGRALGVQGAWGFVRGGMGSIAQACASAARAAGAEIRVSSEVAAVEAPERVGGVATVVLRGGERIRARAVLSNADPVRSFGLLDTGAVPAAIRARLSTWRQRGVSLKLNLALREPPNYTARPAAAGALAEHHRATIHVAPDLAYLQRAHDDLRVCGESTEPMLECFMQSPTDPSAAPPGRHVLSIFAQYYAFDRPEGAWTDLTRERAADRIVATLARYAPNLAAAIEARQILAPPDIEARFGILGGQIFHGELLPGQVFTDRFASRTGVPGFYLCGSGAHPGGCVSGLPGRHAAGAVLEDDAARLAPARGRAVGRRFPG